MISSLTALPRNSDDGPLHNSRPRAPCGPDGRRQVAQRARGSRRIRVDAGGKLPRRGHAGVLPVQRPRRRSGSADLSRLSRAERVPRIRAAAPHRARRVGRRVRARTTAHTPRAASRGRGSELKSRYGPAPTTPGALHTREPARLKRRVARARGHAARSRAPRGRGPIPG